MPNIPLTDSEVEDLLEYVITLTLQEPSPESIALSKFSRPEQLLDVPRLPVLERSVTYEEVDRQVFHKVCWHCHSDADYASGNGGPGNTGGFGYPPRGVSLASWEGLWSGYLDDTGERHSILSAQEGTPRLLAALLARRVEEAGGEIRGVRGMPLGLPPLPLADLQLVESWLAQGAPP